MKYLLTAITVLIGSLSLGQTVKEGDNLQDLYKNMASPNFKAAPQVSYWSEGDGIFFIGSKEFVLLALRDTTLVGLFTQTAPITFLFDTIGNSVLGLSSHVFMLPYWIIKRRAKVLSSDKTILKLMNNLYETTLQANDGHPEMATAMKLMKYRTDTTLYNRHIAFLLDSYQQLVSNSASHGLRTPSNISVPMMRKLTDECVSLFGEIPVLVCIYMGEALQSAGMKDEAREHFKMSLQLYPNSIPLLVYKYGLEEDAIKKKEQLHQLKKEHRKHWMVKDL